MSLAHRQWASAKKIAAILLLDPNDVSACYDLLLKRSLVRKILTNDVTAKERAFKIIKTYEDSKKAGVPEQTIIVKIQREDPPPECPDKKALNIMSWAFREIGNSELAERAYNAVKQFYSKEVQ